MSCKKVWCNTQWLKQGRLDRRRVAADTKFDGIKQHGRRPVFHCPIVASEDRFFDVEWWIMRPTSQPRFCSLIKGKKYHCTSLTSLAEGVVNWSIFADDFVSGR